MESTKKENLSKLCKNILNCKKLNKKNKKNLLKNKISILIKSEKFPKFINKNYYNNVL